MIPMSNSSNFDRRRLGQSHRRPLVRSNSSLLGSIKNFVAAPFARLFTGSPNEFDDPNDISGKRRLIVNGKVNNNDITEDGPAPAKRMRVRSPESDSPPRSPSYLDPPGSFQLGNNNNLSNNSSSRSAPVSAPSDTLPDPSAYNARSTISPLRNHFSRNMSIDSIPSQQSGPLSRDIIMQSLSSIPGDRSVSIRASSRDSLPPHSFRMRDSSTPQPHKSVTRKPIRDLSEPPPMTALHSNPVFVRGPSQIPESHTLSKPVATLGSLVDSQRIVRSPSRQRSLLFGSSQTSAEPQAMAAERTLHELDFYKTPLVPTRIRSRMPSSVAASASSSNITDMFARKHSLILMGDHDRPSRSNKREKRQKAKGKEVRESNETKPYAGTTGIRKRLAKVKGDNEGPGLSPPETTVADKAIDSPLTVKEPVLQDIPVPPPMEKDNFSVVTSSSTSAPAHQSSLRVGRAARSHLSRPVKKFSASYDDDEDKVTDETKKDLEMLEQAAKQVPSFDIPAGFTFAKEVSSLPVEVGAVKELPISALPFSLTNASTPSAAHAAEPPSSGAPLFGPAFDAVPASPQPTDDSVRAPGSKALVPAKKVPDFFASSKAFASQSPSKAAAISMPTLLAPTLPEAPTAASSVFSFAPVMPSFEGEKPKVAESNSALPTISSTVPSLPDFDKQRESQGFSFGSMPPAEERADLKPTFSFGAPVMTFGKAPDVAQIAPASGPSSFSSGPTASSPDGTPKLSFSLEAPSTSFTPASSPLGTANESGVPSGSILFGTSSKSPSLFGAPIESPKLTGSLLGQSSSPAKTSDSSIFTFGQPASGTGSSSSQTLPKSLFGTQPSKSTESRSAFGDANNGGLISPFSFAPPTAGTPTDQPKPLFGGSDGTGDNSKLTRFTFGGSSSAPSTSAGTSPSSFSFGNASSSSAGAGTSFSFGVTPARPITPPNQDQEVRMEESPTRDVQPKPVEPRPSLNGFSFGSAPAPLPNTSSLFGQPSVVPSAGFSFGQPAGDPFSAVKTDEKPESKPFGPSSQASSPFSFGRTAENDPPRPSTAGSFSFGSSSSSNTGPGPTFSFGAPSNNVAPSNPFASAQSSSSSFGQAPSSSFSFGAPSVSNSGGNNPFMFGSQPASPATPSSGLPISGFGSATSNPFGAPTSHNTGFSAPSTPTSGGNLFTIGAAPADSGRQFKKLPSRKKR